MKKLLAELSPAPDAADDAFSYWTFADLQARRIIGSRTDLHRKQRFFGFPKPVVLTSGRGAAALYRVDLVKAWLAEREALALRNREPELKQDSKPRGRPRKAEENATT
jgi:hypothetical protein